MYVLLPEILGEFLAVQLVQVLAGVGQLVGTAEHERVVGVVDDAFQVRHLRRVYLRGHMVAYEEQAGVGVVDDVVNLLRHEFMQDGYCHGPVCQRGQERHGPLAGVAPAEGYLVALYDTAVLEQDMQLFYLACHIVELQGGSLVVGQRIKVPVVNDALLYKLVKTGVVFHNTLLYYLYR